jgi:hypothetical protein
MDFKMRGVIYALCLSMFFPVFDKVTASGPGIMFLSKNQIQTLKRRADKGDTTAIKILINNQNQWIPSCAYREDEDCRKEKNVNVADIYRYQKYDLTLSKGRKYTCSFIQSLATTDTLPMFEFDRKKAYSFYMKNCQPPSWPDSGNLVPRYLLRKN